VGYSLQLAQSRETSLTGAFAYDMYTSHHHKVFGELVDRLDDNAEPTGMVDFCAGHTPHAKGEKDLPNAAEQRLAVGMTDGLAADDRSLHSKMVRESHFPSHIFAHALSCKVQQAASAVESDRDYILNHIAGDAEGQDLWKKAETSHIKYGDMNALIRGHVARMSLVRSTIEYCKGETAAFESLLEGLQHSDIKRIDLCFGQAEQEGFDVHYQIFERLLDALPTSTLAHLVITLPATVKTLPPGRLKQFPHLHTLDLTNSHTLEALPDDLVECYALTTLELSHLQRLVELPKKVLDLPKLNSLNLTGCHLLRQLVGRGVSKSQIEVLYLTDCIGLTDLHEALGSNLVNLHTLHLRGCFNLHSLPTWVARMERDGVAVQRPHHLE